LYNTNTNTERYATSDMADASKTATVEQQAEKKAARRAAFIQEVAEAVYSLGVQRQNEIEAKRQQADCAARLTRQARQATENALYNAAHPLEAAYLASKGLTEWGRAFFTKPRDKELVALRWAVARGILPMGTAIMPDEQEQYAALALLATSQHPSQ
jgi:hypothetical protein